MKTATNSGCGADREGGEAETAVEPLEAIRMPSIAGLTALRGPDSTTFFFIRGGHKAATHVIVSESREHQATETPPIAFYSPDSPDSKTDSHSTTPVLFSERGHFVF